MSQQQGRLHQLDALRGLAAVAVALMHFKSLWLNMPGTHLTPVAQVAVGLTRFITPGGEAVILFFVLSGFVLSLPSYGGNTPSYPTFLVRRIIRIYGPYIVALAVALLADSLLRPYLVHQGDITAVWSEPLRWRLVLAHVLMIGKYDTGQYDMVLWTLVQEMRISLFFPLVVFITNRLSTIWAVALALAMSVASFCVIGSAGGQSSSDSVFLTLHFTAFFVLGIILARNVTAIQAYWPRLSRVQRWVIGLTSLTLCFVDGLAATALQRILHLPLSYDQRYGLAAWIASAGIVGVLMVSISGRRAGQALAHPLPQFLGRISYSLYLLHPVVLLSTTALCYGRVPWWAQFVLYAAGTVGLSWLFYAVVEQRFTRLSRMVPKWSPGAHPLLRACKAPFVRSSPVARQIR